MGILFNLKKHVLNPEIPASCQMDTTVLTGPSKQAIHLRVEPDTLTLSIRFLPGGAYLFFRELLQNSADRILPISDTILPGIDALSAALREAQNTEMRIILLEHFLYHQLHRFQAPPIPWVHHVVQTMKQHQGSLQIEELATRFSLSRRHFERRFKHETALAPKHFSKALRIHKAHALMRALRMDSLTEVGYACDFYDQAHFIRDFKRYTGETPGSYLKRKRESMSRLYNF